jgi:hypothetical protein
VNTENQSRGIGRYVVAGGDKDIDTKTKLGANTDAIHTTDIADMDSSIFAHNIIIMLPELVFLSFIIIPSLRGIFERDVYEKFHVYSVMCIAYAAILVSVYACVD